MLKTCRTTAYEHENKEFRFKVVVASDTLIQEVNSTFETHNKGEQHVFGIKVLILSSRSIQVDYYPKGWRQST